MMRRKIQHVQKITETAVIIIYSIYTNGIKKSTAIAAVLFLQYPVWYILKTDLSEKNIP
jgi:hypothetical protein